MFKNVIISLVIFVGANVFAGDFADLELSEAQIAEILVTIEDMHLNDERILNLISSVRTADELTKKDKLSELYTAVHQNPAFNRAIAEQLNHVETMSTRDKLSLLGTMCTLFSLACSTFSFYVQGYPGPIKNFVIAAAGAGLMIISKFRGATRNYRTEFIGSLIFLYGAYRVMIQAFAIYSNSQSEN